MVSSVLLFGTVRQLNLGQCGEKATLVRRVRGTSGSASKREDGQQREKEGSGATCAACLCVCVLCCQREAPSYARSATNNRARLHPLPNRPERSRAFSFRTALYILPVVFSRAATFTRNPSDEGTSIFTRLEKESDLRRNFRKQKEKTNDFSIRVQYHTYLINIS